MCTIVAIAGLFSEVGKTTLLCNLLQKFSGWEAIKMTRGHYRSCGKAPNACCVSHLLGDEPLIRSGFQQTYAACKDTGRYWDAGAANVHWVITTDDQVERGLQLALERVRAPGVLIEGNSFLRFLNAHFTIVVAGDAALTVKASTRWAFQKASALYISGRSYPDTWPSEIITLLNARFAPPRPTHNLPVYTSDDFPRLAACISRIHSSRTSGNENLST